MAARRAIFARYRAGLGDLLAFADGNEKLAAFRAPLLGYRARYGCDPTG